MFLCNGFGARSDFAPTRIIIVRYESGGRVSRGKIALIVVALAIVAGVAFFLGGTGPVAITVANESSAPLAGVTLVSATGFRTPVPTVGPGELTIVRPRLGTSDDDLELADASGARYTVLGYVTGNPGGHAIVTITDSTAGSLVGRVSVRADAQPSGDFPLRREP